MVSHCKSKRATTGTSEEMNDTMKLQYTCLCRRYVRVPTLKVGPPHAYSRSTNQCPCAETKDCHAASTIKNSVENRQNQWSRMINIETNRKQKKANCLTVKCKALGNSSLRKIEMFNRHSVSLHHSTGIVEILDNAARNSTSLVSLSYECDADIERRRRW